jgi:hypothetical protein
MMMSATVDARAGVIVIAVVAPRPAGRAVIAIQAMTADIQPARRRNEAAGGDRNGKKRGAMERRLTRGV